MGKLSRAKKTSAKLVTTSVSAISAPVLRPEEIERRRRQNETEKQDRVRRREEMRRAGGWIPKSN